MNKIVIGLGFGDEGKGATVNYLCSQFQNKNNIIVQRFSGGHQAGHTVIHDGKHHVFSNFGSGTLQGIKTYWSNNCTVDPIGIYNEYQILKEKGITPKLIIHPECPITTPYDKYANLFCYKTKKHGTCGVGFGKTLERESKNYYLKMIDIKHDFVFKTKMEMIDKHYYSINNSFLKENLSLFYDAIDFIKNSNDIEMNPCLMFNKNVIYEGSQGLLLDKNIGFFPHVSNIDLVSLFYNLENSYETFYVTRAYQTRHGNGPMSNLDKKHNIKIKETETNKNNSQQGEFRISLLDLDLLKYSLEKCNTIYPKTLVITCLDDIVGEYKYTINGKIKSFKTKKDFVMSICKYLDFTKCLVSDNYNFEEYL